MSNQEQQFYPPESYPPGRYSPPSSNQYYEGRNSVNVDPSEQQAMYGAPEYYTGRGEKLQPHPVRRKGFRILWLLPIVLLFLIGGMSYGLFGFHEHSGKREYKQVFNIANTPKIIINDNAGTIHIRSDEESSKGNTITIRTDKSGDFQPNPIVNYDKVQGVIRITATQQGFGDNNVNLDITMPKTSNVQLTDGNGDVTINGVTGSVNAQTTQGRIDANNVSGQVTLSSTNGEVSVENGNLSGQSSLHSGNGDIRYNGSIDTNGSYTFDTVNGSVDVRLPSDAAFHLNAKSTMGRYENEFLSNDVGNGTRPSLTVSSENGSIHVGKNG